MSAYVSFVQTAIHFCRGQGLETRVTQPPAGDAGLLNRIVVIYVFVLSTVILFGFVSPSLFLKSTIPI